MTKDQVGAVKARFGISDAVGDDVDIDFVAPAPNTQSSIRPPKPRLITSAYRPPTN